VSASVQRVCRLAQEAADADDPLSALETIVELRREPEDFTREQVARGLAANRSFGEVARALGISRQAAHRRYRELAPAAGPRIATTEQVRRVLQLAREEARSTRAPALGSHHLLIGVILRGGDAAMALIDADVTVERIRAWESAMAAEAALPSGFRNTRSEVRELLREATQAAISLGERWIDVTGLLSAALADPHGGARRVLAALDVDVSAVRARLERDARFVHQAPNMRRRDVG